MQRWVHICLSQSKWPWIWGGGLGLDYKISHNISQNAITISTFPNIPYEFHRIFLWSALALLCTAPTITPPPPCMLYCKRHTVHKHSLLVRNGCIIPTSKCPSHNWAFMACKYALDDDTTPARLMTNDMATKHIGHGRLGYVIVIASYMHKALPSVHVNTPP